MSANKGSFFAKRRYRRGRSLQPRRSISEGSARYVFGMPKRLVIIGDLNGDDDALRMMLRSMTIINQNGDWIAQDCHLVQLGDIVNRGTESRRALERLIDLAEQAPKKGSRVTVLLGNHEAMVTLGNEAWCTGEEYLEFATREERANYDVARSRHIYELLEQHSHAGRTGPVGGALKAWEEQNVPGKFAYREAFGPHGRFGRFIRSLPIAIRVGNILLVHGGLMPKYARLGLKVLNQQTLTEWQSHPRTHLDLKGDSVILAENGPLWCRSLALGVGPRTRAALEDTLAMLRCSTMIVGHTRTDHLEEGERGHPLARHDGRLICADVGIGTTGGSAAALFIEKKTIWCWRPDENKRRLCLVPELLGAENDD